MDFILKSIQEQINCVGKSKEELRNIVLFNQVRLEYILILTLAYLWNEKYRSCSIYDQHKILSKIEKPMLGTIIEICKILDFDNSFFGANPNLKDYFLGYKEIRNNYIGHGFTFSDEGIVILIEMLEKVFNNLKEQKFSIIDKNWNYIKVKKYVEEEKIYEGILYSPSGDQTFWSQDAKFKKYEIDAVYISNFKDTFMVSPFIHLKGWRGIYLFQRIEEKLNSTILYNKLFETGQERIKWPKFQFQYLPQDDKKRLTENKTVTNIFNKNYNRYIQIPGIQEKLSKSLIGENRNARVCITIWGHGGVGKTAITHQMIDYLGKTKKKCQKFDYIIFLSAKDRYYDYEKGKILKREKFITSYQDLITQTNEIIFNKSIESPERLKKYNGKLLLIIDDFETLEKKDRDLIKDELIDKFSASNHKVILTTRIKSQMIGYPISVNELNKIQSKSFLSDAIESYFPSNITSKIRSELELSNIADKLQKVTTGRPLFILQLVHYLRNTGGQLKELLSIDEVLNIKSTPDAIEFLYGRIYQMLGEDSQFVYNVMGKITPKSGLNYRLDALKHILDEFLVTSKLENSIQELIDLKVIEVIDNIYYKIYSEEILDLMLSSFNRRVKDSLKTKIIKRYKTIHLSIEKNPFESFLTNLKKLSYEVKFSYELTSAYNAFIANEKCSKGLKVKAIIRCSNDLINLFNDYGESIKFCEDNILKNPWLKEDTDFIEKYSEHLWNAKSRIKSIDVLKSHFSYLDSNTFQNEKDLYLNLTFASILIWRECDYWENARRSTKRNKHSNNRKIERELENQKKKFREIVSSRPATFLIDWVRKLNTEETPSEVVLQFTKGVASLVSIFDRLKQINIINSLCKLVINRFDIHYTAYFKDKLEEIKIRREKKPEILIFKHLIRENLLHKKLKGKISNIRKGYGALIKCGQLKEDIFFYSSELKNWNFDFLSENSKVTFYIGETWSGVTAISVNVLDEF